MSYLSRSGRCSGQASQHNKTLERRPPAVWDFSPKGTSRQATRPREYEPEALASESQERLPGGAPSVARGGRIAAAAGTAAFVGIAVAEAVRQCVLIGKRSSADRDRFKRVGPRRHRRETPGPDAELAGSLSNFLPGPCPVRRRPVRRRSRPPAVPSRAGSRGRSPCSCSPGRPERRTSRY